MIVFGPIEKLSVSGKIKFGIVTFQSKRNYFDSTRIYQIRNPLLSHFGIVYLISLKLVHAFSSFD